MHVGMIEMTLEELSFQFHGGFIFVLLHALDGSGAKFEIDRISFPIVGPCMSRDWCVQWMQVLSLPFYDGW